MFVTFQQLPDAIARFTNKTMSSLSPRLKNPNKFDGQPKLFFLHSDDDVKVEFQKFPQKCYLTYFIFLLDLET